MSSSAADGEVPEAFRAPASVGGFDGAWLTEVFEQAARHGIRASKRLHEETSPWQRITVYETRFFGRVLTLDDLVMVTERDEFVYHEMLAHVPICSIPGPRAVLIIGGGDCGTLREVLKHPEVERAVLCEIDERVTRVSARFFPWVEAACADARVTLVFADGARFLEASPQAFDIVLIDSTDPVGPAAGLFLRDFYRKVARALRPGGVLAAQTESPFWSPRLVSAVYAELGSQFAHVSPYVGFVPTYPSGMWSWAWASADREHDHYVDAARAEKVRASCRYYHPDLQRAAFSVPTFVKAVIEGSDPFERFDRRRPASPGGPAGGDPPEVQDAGTPRSP
jgi:spermidine synthase